MENQNIVSGPFGKYPVGSFGEILNTMVRYYGIPLMVVESMQINNEAIIYLNEKIATFSLENNSERTTINFIHPNFSRYNKE